MNGFGFIEYSDALDARDVVPGMATLFLSKAQEYKQKLTLSCSLPWFGLYGRALDCTVCAWLETTRELSWTRALCSSSKTYASSYGNLGTSGRYELAGLSTLSLLSALWILSHTVLRSRVAVAYQFSFWLHMRL